MTASTLVLNAHSGSAKVKKGDYYLVCRSSSTANAYANPNRMPPRMFTERTSRGLAVRVRRLDAQVLDDTASVREGRIGPQNGESFPGGF